MFSYRYKEEKPIRMEDQDSDWDSDVPGSDHHPVLDLELVDRFLTSCRNGDTCHVTECLASVRVSPHVSSGLVEAARAGHTEVVEMLVVREDCDVNTRDRDGDTPLSHACCCGHYAVVKVLLSVPDLDINTSDMDQVSPLHKAIANNHFDVVELLLKQPDIKVMSLRLDFSVFFSLGVLWDLGFWEIGTWIMA